MTASLHARDISLALGARHILGARRDQNLARTNLQRHALKGLFGRMQVAAVVVDQNRQAQRSDLQVRREFSKLLVDFFEESWPAPHSAPFVEGRAPPSRGSGSTASRRARATALKQASAMWWLFSPWIRSTCRVMPPWVASA